MRLLCIDPGTNESGMVIFGGKKILARFPSIDNYELLEIIKTPHRYDHLAIEMVASYGMSVGQSVFDTCVWIGRFIQACPQEYTKIFRKDVKMCLCHSMRAKDKNIRQAIIDMFPASGGGKIPQIGIKKYPGELYGISKHAWAALAVGITWFTEMN